MIDKIKELFIAFQDFIANLTFGILQKTGLDYFYKTHPRRFFLSLTIILITLFLSVTVFGKIVIKKTIIPQRETYSFDLDQELIPPAEPLLKVDYQVTREQKDRWNDEEIAQWFSIPNEYMIEKLHEDNTRLVQKIMEVSP